MNQFLFSIIAVFCLANLSWAQVKTSSQNDLAEQAKLRKAEQTVVRAMRRFGQTLDFKDVYREFYVRDKASMKKGLESEMGDKVNNLPFTEFDDLMLEKLFIQSQNGAWLNWIFYFEENNTRLIRGEKDFNKLKNEVLPRLNNQQKTLYKKMESEEPVFKTKEDFLDLFVINKFAIISIRNHFPVGLQYNLQHNVTTNAFPNKISLADSNAYLMKYKGVYDVEARIKNIWGHYHFTVVEEFDVMKIESAWIADN